MGIKLLKEKLNIGYIVQKEGDEIYIGSPWVHDLITIKKDGEAVIKNRLLDGGCAWDELNRLVEKVQKAAASGELKDWICTPDTLENLKPVYTCEYGKVVKKYCEEYGWPNLTTEGEIMYDNTFFKNGLLTLTGWCFNCREWPHMKHKQVTISDRTSLEVGQALIDERNILAEGER